VDTIAFPCAYFLSARMRDDQIFPRSAFPPPPLISFVVVSRLTLGFLSLSLRLIESEPLFAPSSPPGLRKTLPSVFRPDFAYLLQQGGRVKGLSWKAPFGVLFAPSLRVCVLLSRRLRSGVFWNEKRPLIRLATYLWSHFPPSTLLSLFFGKWHVSQIRILQSSFSPQP